MDESTPSTEESFFVLYFTIDELYQEVSPDPLFDATRPLVVQWKPISLRYRLVVET